jgi:hypothetical protein
MPNLCKNLIFACQICNALHHNIVIMSWLEVQINCHRYYINLIWIILDRHTSYNVNDLKVPSSVTNI